MPHNLHTSACSQAALLFAAQPERCLQALSCCKRSAAAHQQPLAQMRGICNACQHASSCKHSVMIQLEAYFLLHNASAPRSTYMLSVYQTYLGLPMSANLPVNRQWQIYCTIMAIIIWLCNCLVHKCCNQAAVLWYLAASGPVMKTDQRTHLDHAVASAHLHSMHCVSPSPAPCNTA